MVFASDDPTVLFYAILKDKPVCHQMHRLFLCPVHLEPLQAEMTNYESQRKQYTIYFRSIHQWVSAAEQQFKDYYRAGNIFRKKQ